MSIVTGGDVGSLTSKAVIMKNGRIIGSHIIKKSWAHWVRPFTRTKRAGK